MKGRAFEGQSGIGRPIGVFTCLAFAIVSTAMAEVSPNSLFTDNMVLQRDREIPVWGTGDAGAAVEVTLGGPTAKTKVGEDGKWRAVLKPIPAGGPHELGITSGAKSIRLKNVMVGDVWLCSGQSNMAMATSEASNAALEIPEAANYPKLRLFLVGKNPANAPQPAVKGQWKVCSPESAGEFSAVGYFFGRDLQRDAALNNTPIGLIDASFGGTVAEAWMPADFFFARFPGEKPRDSIFGFKPFTMYNGLIAPLTQFPLRGVLWYQGESNCDQPEQYSRLFPALIGKWRELWHQPDLPFLFVQLPNYAEPFVGAHFTQIREVQAEVARTVPNTAMAVTIDVGDPHDVHPADKQDVGHRLALLARAKVYGEDVLCSGPEYESLQIDGDAVRVKFRSIAKGLVNRNCNGPLRGFSLAGDDGLFRYADAAIEGTRVKLQAVGVAAPRFVRYAWGANPNADLCNEDGLPAGPFRTDNLSDPDIELELVPASREVATANYAATVNGDGNLVSLKIKGEEFLASPGDELPGSFFPGWFGPARLVHTTPLGPRLLEAKAGALSIVYQFRDDSLVLMLENRGGDGTSFLIALSKGVEAVAGNGETLAVAPEKQQQERTTWYRGKSWLRIDGTGTPRRPYDANHANPAWETRLSARSQAQIRLSFGAVSEKEAAQLEQLRSHPSQTP